MKAIFLFVCISIFINNAFSQDAELLKKLDGFDAYMADNLKNWNTPGVGVGIVKGDKLVFVKGYGYRDYDKKLPITESTLFQIASNTKLFTATAVGMEVEKGNLEWDKPIKNFVPTIQFYNNELNNMVTIRDMLSHRTGITRHDLIWYKANYSRKELFGKLKYLEPIQPLRQGFLYNNLMYVAAGYLLEVLTNTTWEEYLQTNIFDPLDMKSTVYGVENMKKISDDYFVPYGEKRDTNILYQIPWYEENGGMGPAGNIVSNIKDMSHWLIAQMNDGKYLGKQVIPSSVIQATLEPSIPDGNTTTERFKELQNRQYGMGRDISSYRGHLLTNHGGALDGIFSQISFMPQDSIGVIVFAVGDMSRPLIDIVSYNVYERLLGMSITPWSERGIEDRDVSKKMGRLGRGKASEGQIKNTRPSHLLADYMGDFENEAYGIIKITNDQENQMQFTLHAMQLPLNHYHYDRFDTPNDEQLGYFSLNYQTNPQGEIDRFVVSLDEGQVTFVKKVDERLNNVETLSMYVGKYKSGNSPQEVIIKNKTHLYLTGHPDLELIPYKPGIFKIKEFSDLTFQFVIENGKVVSMIQKDPSGEYEMKRVEGEEN